VRRAGCCRVREMAKWLPGHKIPLEVYSSTIRSVYTRGLQLWLMHDRIGRVAISERHGLLGPPVVCIIICQRPISFSAESIGCEFFISARLDSLAGATMCSGLTLLLIARSPGRCKGEVFSLAEMEYGRDKVNCEALHIRTGGADARPREKRKTGRSSEPVYI
jgi:hypothetical protein